MTERPNVLVIRRRFLGEIVLLGPLLRNLRLAWPDAALTVAVEPRFADVLALNPDRVAALPLPTRLLGWPAFLRSVRRARFTHVIDLEATSSTGLIAKSSRAPTRIAAPDPGRTVARPPAYSAVVPDRSGSQREQPAVPRVRHPGHAAPPDAESAVRSSLAADFLRALEPLGLPIVTDDARLEPRPDEVATVQRFVGASERVLLVHPGTRGNQPGWPADRFAAAIDFAQDKLSAQAIVVGGTNEAAQLAAIRQQVHTHLLSVPGVLTVARFAALARISDAVLCHESGFMHLAAAVGAPVVALCAEPAPSPAPLGAGHRLLRADTPGAPLDDLAIAAVCAAVRRTVESRPRRTTLLPPPR